VRELLIAGCNPGTKAKPRWAPIYNAIRGASDKHNKCLTALLTHGANVNATRSSNGRTHLHYAIELEPWAGYSTLIYILLVNRAIPNVCDNAKDIPLLMLLAGNGPLPQEKRDALILLLAPDYNANIDVKVPGTLDNPLHLAIRRKDPHTVDAILDKIKQLGDGSGRKSRLVHAYNGSSFTPVLLAFTIFSFKGEYVEEEIQIARLLLKNGANPNDQDATKGNTPLHLVISVSQNTIALELLCRHHANPRISNVSRMTALDLAQRLRDTPAALSEDKWYAFAERRMTNTLQKDHYRPPELVSFLAEERDELSDKRSWLSQKVLESPILTSKRL
jgi:ankyrin repeat protein